MTQPIRILIADDHPIIREAIASLLNSQEDMTVIGKASNGVKVVEMAKALEPDVVLMDYEMPEKDGVEATHEILAVRPETVVISFSMHENDTIKKSMHEAGVAVHVSKHGSNTALLDAIRLFGRGRD